MRIQRSFTILITVLVLSAIPTLAESADYSCTNCNIDQSTGRGNSCAVRQDGSIACWGSDANGKSTPPILNPDAFSFTSVSAGMDHTCAVVDCIPGFDVICPVCNVRCWGNDDFGQASPDPSDRFLQVSAGGDHSCGLRVDNLITCWGRNDNGQSAAPPPPLGRRFIQVSAGIAHTCAVTECTDFPCWDSTNVVCWGLDTLGQATVPDGLGQFTQISSGLYHVCGVRIDGSVACWGSNQHDQSTPPAGSFVQVSAGYSHSCGVRVDGSIAGWGDYYTSGSFSPPAGSFRQVSAAEDHACGIRVDGSVICWGYLPPVPPAGLCGIFRGDLEEGGDCRWSNGSEPCWSADCDGDGFAARDALGFCRDTPMGVPAECPAGAWTAQPAGCGAYDCMDYNPLVHSNQMLWFSAEYAPEPGRAMNRFDYNCDGVEEKRYVDLSTNLCCVPSYPGCIAVVAGSCEPLGWDATAISEIPDCGEAADFLTCWELLPGICIPTVETRVQSCR